jgi:hypothetical protein
MHACMVAWHPFKAGLAVARMRSRGGWRNDVDATTPKTPLSRVGSQRQRSGERRG